MPQMTLYSVELYTQTKIKGEELDPDSWDREDPIDVRADDAELAIKAAKDRVIGLDRSWTDEDEGEEYSAEVVAARVESVVRTIVTWELDA